MKRSAIRLLSTICKLALVGLSLFLCFYFYGRARGNFYTPDPVGLVQNSSIRYLEPDYFAAALQEENFPLVSAATGDNLADTRALLDQGARLVIVTLERGEADEAPKLIAAARKADATILFMGVPPEEKDLDRYGKAWYLGSRAALGGETMGHALAMESREGHIPDGNGDTLLQTVIFQEGTPDSAETLVDFTFDECEHYGVYSADFSPEAAPAPEDGPDPTAGMDAFEKQLYEQQKHEAAESPAGIPDLLLCVGQENHDAAHEAIRQNGWATEAGSPYVASFATNRRQAEAFAKDGDGTVVYYDQEGISRTAVLFARNLERGEALAEGTGLFPDGRNFFVPYQVLE